MVLNGYFEGDLNLHSSIESLENPFIEPDYEDEKFNASILEKSKFARLNLSQKHYFQTLEIANGSYEDFIISAIYYYLEILNVRYLKRIEFSSDKTFTEFTRFSGYGARFLLNRIFGKQLFIILQSTNLFLIYAYSWLYGFTITLQTFGSDKFGPYETRDRAYFFDTITMHFPANFRNIRFYLDALSDFIPKLVMYTIRKYCYVTKSTHVLYYVLKKYQNIFNSTLNHDKKIF